MSELGHSLSGLELEIAELRKDYVAFCTAYDLLCKRITESSETVPSRTPVLHTWSGTRAVIGSLEMSCHAIERTIIEYADVINKVKSGEIPNTDAPRPVLSLVKETDRP